MSRRDDIIEAIKRKLRESGYHIEEPDESEGETVTRVKRNDSADSEPPTLFGIPIRIVKDEGENEHECDGGYTCTSDCAGCLELELADKVLFRSEVTIFTKGCPMHFPLAEHFMASIEGNKVGMALTKHQEPNQGETAWRPCDTNKEANAIYEGMLDQLVEREYTMIYRGKRNFG